MCGLCFAKNFKGQPARDMIIQQFERQRSRGTSGFGFVANTGTPMLRKRTTEADIKKELKKCNAPEILFHHHIPTSTPNVINACHPFKVKGTKTGHWYYVVHNGILNNEDDLKKEHDDLNLKYKSMQPDGKFNDSEALAYDVMLYLEGEQETLKARGTIAFICQEYDENSVAVKLHFARNSGNPLHMRIKQGQSFQLASEGPWPEIKQDVHYTFDYETNILSEKELDIKRYLPRSESSYNAADDDKDYSRNYYKGSKYYNPIYASEYFQKTEYNWTFKANVHYADGFDSAYEQEEATRGDRADCYFQMGEDEFELDRLCTKYNIEKDGEEAATTLKTMQDLKDNLEFCQGFLDGVECNLREKYEKVKALPLPF